MKEYDFYLEYDRRTIPQDYRVPTDTIVEITVENAAKKFAKREKLKYIDYDTLLNDNNAYRAFFQNKRNELTFYVRER